MKYSIKADAEVEKDASKASEGSENFIVCDVCGFANEPQNALCKQCSNYLFGGEKQHVFQK